MKFEEISNIFEKLESKSKRLEKIIILRDLIKENQKIGFLVFDLISGNFQREINKKNLSISIKTLFNVLSFVSKTSEKKIEEKFNKTGDIGLVAMQVLDNKKQKSLFQKELYFNNILESLKEISKISGNNSNTKKKEILSNLFLLSNTKNEYKFLARILIDDLRIGVSNGVLKETSVNAFFPKIIGIHQYCKPCNYFSLNSKTCYNCQNKIETQDEEKSINTKYQIIETSTPANIIGLENFIGDKSNKEKIKFLLRINPKKQIIKTKNPREIYNLFISLFEKKYNLINNYQIILTQISTNLLSILDAKIEIFLPIKSMLGTRVKNIDEAFEVSKKPAFVDFKYDGLRMQIHNNFGDIKLFSRNLDNITKQFPEIVEFIKTNYSDINFVIDSECVGYDYKKEKFLDFQILSRRIMSKNISDVSNINIKIKFFDIIYLNSETLIDKKYEIRRKLVENLMLNRELKQKINFDIKKINRFKHNFEY